MERPWPKFGPNEIQELLTRGTYRSLDTLTHEPSDQADELAAVAGFKESTIGAFAALTWVRDHIRHTIDHGWLAPDQAEELMDHVDECAEILLRPICAAMELSGLTSEQTCAMLDEAEQARPPSTDVSLEQMRGAITESLQYVSFIAPASAGILGLLGRLDADTIEGIESDLADAQESIRAGLDVIEPNQFSRILEAIEDPDERIAEAREQEQIEMRREVVQGTNEQQRMVSEASDALTLLSKDDPDLAAGIWVKLQAVTDDTAKDLQSEISTRTGVAPEVAWALVWHFLWPQHVTASS